MSATLPPLPYPQLDSLPTFTEPGYTADQVRAYGAECARAARLAEREECARLVETKDTNGDHVGGWLELLAAAIRARSET